MAELLAIELPVFCNESCAAAFPYHGTDEFTQKIATLKEQFSRPPVQPAPLEAKCQTTESLLSRKPPEGETFFSLTDIRAAVGWLKKQIQGTAYFDQRILQDIDQAFKDVKE